MSQPKVPKIKMPGMSMGQMKSPLMQATLSPEIFEELIAHHGIRMIHSRPVPCPNVRDLNDGSHSPACNFCFNGFFYYDKKEFVGVLFSNSMDRRFQAQGTWDLDNAYIIVPVRDSDGEILDVQYFDQIVIPDFTVRYYQRIEHSQSGIDRAQFPVISIDYLVDASGKVYSPDVDFIADNGRISWVQGGERPGYDPIQDKGVIYSVNYYTRPAFTVVGLPHQLRMTQTKDETGNNVQARYPQLCSVRKDFIPYDHADEEGAPDRPEPRNGSF
jgi:hypothetical protein